MEDATAVAAVNQGGKVHAELPSRKLRTWSGTKCAGNEFIFGVGDGSTTAGNTYLVSPEAEARRI